MRERDEVAVDRLVLHQLAEAALAAADRAGDGVDLGQALLGGARQALEPFERPGGPLEHVGHLDRPLGGDPAQLRHRGRVGPSGRQLDDLRADQPLGDDPGQGVGADQRPQPLIDPQHQLDRPARLARRDHPLDHTRVDPLDPHPVAGLQPADRRELRPDAERRLHAPVPPRHLIDPETGQRQHRQGEPDVDRRTPRTDVAPHGAHLSGQLARGSRRARKGDIPASSIMNCLLPDIYGLPTAAH